MLEASYSLPPTPERVYRRGKSQLERAGEQDDRLIPLGVSISNPETTAGTLGAKVIDLDSGRELILTGAPYIERIQTVPDIKQSKVKVVAEIENVDARESFDLHFRLREARTGKNVESGAVGIAAAAGKHKMKVSSLLSGGASSMQCVRKALPTQMIFDAMRLRMSCKLHLPSTTTRHSRKRT